MVTEDWTSGYVADIGYTYGYYAELNPLNTQMAFLSAGLQPPRIAIACELGFGQGVSVNLHAAASQVQWWGTDFNPAQAGFAQDLARTSGSGAKLFDQSFAEFCARPDLPQMDFIALHGIWSWISDDNRNVIVDFVRRRLNVGGVLCVSYNTQPGWAAMVPMRELFVEHAAVMGSPGQGRLARVDAALAFAEKMLAADPAFARVNPTIGDRFKKVAAYNRNYLAHEYFNRDWQPMSFAQMSRWLAPAKMTYACSANPIDHAEALNLTPAQQELLAQIPDAGFRQTVRDFCVNQQFRKDYWVKGARTLASAEQVELLRQQSFILVTPIEEVTMKASGAQGEIGLLESIYQPVLAALSKHEPKTLRSLYQEAGQGMTLGQLVQAVVVLTAKGNVRAVQSTAAVDQARPACQRINRHLIDGAKLGKETQHLASPVVAGGVPATRFQHLFLDSIARGKATPDEWARDAWQILAAQGERLMKDGQPIESAEQNLAELVSHAKDCEAKQLPILRALAVT